MANAVTVIVSGNTTAGETVVVACPSGERFQSGTIVFYRSSKNTKQPIATVNLVPTTDNSGGQAVAPKRARYYQATAACAPIRTTITASGVQVADEIQRVDCPANYPYVTENVYFYRRR
jgi:hypothetical protein